MELATIWTAIRYTDDILKAPTTVNEADVWVGCYAIIMAAYEWHVERLSSLALL
jgi:hypothetical protein